MDVTIPSLSQYYSNQGVLKSLQTNDTKQLKWSNKCTSIGPYINHTQSSFALCLVIKWQILLGGMRLGGGELSDKVCESVSAQASFKCDIWRHFGSPISRNEKGENVTER